MEVVIEVVEDDVEGSLGDVHHGEVEGSVIVVAWSGVFAKVMPVFGDIGGLEVVVIDGGFGGQVEDVVEGGDEVGHDVGGEVHGNIARID